VKGTWLYSTAALLTGLFFGPVTNGGETTEKPPQIIILKLDDVIAQGTDARSPVPPRWQRVADFVEESHIKASFGIIGFSLEQDNRAYFDWIKNLHQKGNIEFWNHGYKNRKDADKTGEFEDTFEKQKTALERTQKLAKEKLGIELKVFGAHWSGTNKDTAKALEGIPEITMLFYDPRDSKKFVFEQVLALENPIFVPDAEKFKELYEARAKNKTCLALQGHPNAWDEKRWAGFVKIIEFLKSQGCVFMTPSEYLAKTPRR
jgi:peptidoglycan/xylan/chitin deacetylase (PgdA/CDA1 family)